MAGKGKSARAVTCICGEGHRSTAAYPEGLMARKCECSVMRGKNVTTFTADAVNLFAERKK